MKALPKRKGNLFLFGVLVSLWWASMKALPKRKGNRPAAYRPARAHARLNESPSEKEGKYGPPVAL